MPGNLSAQDSQSIIDGLLDDLVKQRQLPSREEAETQTKPPSSSKQIPKSEPKPEPQPELKPEPQPELKPEPQPELKPEPQPEPKPEPQPEPKLESESQPEPASVKPSLGMVQVINRSDRNAVLRLFSDELRESGRVIAPGKLELWSGLPAAEQGEIVMDGHRRPFEVRPNRALIFTILSNGEIVSGKVKSASPNRRSDSEQWVHDSNAKQQPSSTSGRVKASPVTAKSTTSREAFPAPLLTAKAMSNPVPKIRVAELGEDAAESICTSLDQDLSRLLDRLLTAADQRLETVAAELAAKGCPPEDTKLLIEMATTGNAQDLSATLQDPVGVARRFENIGDWEDQLITSAKFYRQFRPLRMKYRAQVETAELQSHIEQLKGQAAELDLADLATMMKSFQQHLMVRDTIRQAAFPQQESTSKRWQLPVDETNVIRHPQIDEGVLLVGKNQLILTHSSKPEIQIERGNFLDVVRWPLENHLTPFPDWEEPEVIQGVMIHNPIELDATVNYRLNGESFRLQAGTQQFLDAGEEWIIEFRRGSEGPDLRYDISQEGTYAFELENGQWNLRQKRFETTLVNPVGSRVFHVMVDGRPDSIEPGTAARYESNYPILIQFDRGNGETLASKLITSKAPLYVALDTDQNEWNLYRRSAVDSWQVPSEALSLSLVSLETVMTLESSRLFEFGAVTQQLPIEKPQNSNLLEALQAFDE